jgi:hypothetical protein
MHLSGQAGVVLKCRRLEHAYNPIPVYEDLSAFKLNGFTRSYQGESLYEERN